MFQWQQLASIQGLHVTFTDANKDGLADALLYSPGSGTSTLYANTGDGFVAQPVGAFASLGMGVSAPLAADVAGSGNAELYCLVAGKARTVALDAAPTGLLQEADDGRGTRLQLGYARGPAAPGAYQQQTVLDTLRVRSAGDDEVAYTYGYASPRAHTAGRYLLGYQPTALGTLPAAQADAKGAPPAKAAMDAAAGRRPPWTSSSRRTTAKRLQSSAARSSARGAPPVDARRAARRAEGAGAAEVPPACSRAHAVVLVGLPELEARLATSLHKPLLSRLHTRVHLAPVCLDDSAEYLRHRLRLAGCERELFPRDAVALLHEASEGAHRELDRLAQLCLRDAARLKRKLVDTELVRGVLECAQLAA